MSFIPKYEHGKTKLDALDKKLININFIKKLPRKNLNFKTNECKLLFNIPNLTEDVFIQYPGKESINPKSSKYRPWDFRPKLILSNNTFLKDLSFTDIWDLLFEIGKNVPLNHRNHILKLIACEFYRIAFMIDYDLIYPNEICTIKNINSNRTIHMSKPNEFYIYSPNMSVINELKKYITNIHGMSWEAFFIYNDLLALNEDCKYFYSKYTSHDYAKAKNYIKNGAGRTNTMLTYLSILALFTGDINFGYVAGRLSRNGVCPITIEKCNIFLGQYMHKNNNHMTFI